MNVGNIYNSSGGGVPQDYAEAMRWYRMAADQGNAGAIFNIAMTYNRSEGVPLDTDELYFWFYLCSKGTLPHDQGEHVTKACKVLSGKLSFATLIEIQERADQWVGSHPKIHFSA